MIILLVCVFLYVGIRCIAGIEGKREHRGYVRYCNPPKDWEPYPNMK
jgi:hypothetical protein